MRRRFGRASFSRRGPLRARASQAAARIAAIPAAERFSAPSAPPLRQRSPGWQWARCPRIPHAGPPRPCAPSTQLCCAGPRPLLLSRRERPDAFNQGVNHDHQARRKAPAHAQGRRSPRHRRRVWQRPRPHRAVPESRTYRVAPPPSHSGANRYRGALADEIRRRAAGSAGHRPGRGVQRHAVLRRDHAALPEKAASRPAGDHVVGIQRPVPAADVRGAPRTPDRGQVGERPSTARSPPRRACAPACTCTGAR